MDDVRQENKRIKLDKIKTVVTVHLQKRGLPRCKPQLISKETALKKCRVDNRVTRRNHVPNKYIHESESLLSTYSSLFQKFIVWLREQKQCKDLEAIVGSLFCHFYIEVRGSEEDTGLSSQFFRSHIKKVNLAKCDDRIRAVLRAIETINNAPNSILNGMNFEKLREQFRSSKIVIYLKPQSLGVLRKFVASSKRSESHYELLHALEFWFDIRVQRDNGDSKMIVDEWCIEDMEKEPRDSKAAVMEQALRMWCEMNFVKTPKNEEDDKTLIGENVVSPSKEYKTKPQHCFSADQKERIKNAIKLTWQLPPSMCNIRIMNNKQFVTSGLIAAHANFIAIAESNILRLLPMQVLVDSLCGEEDIDHIKLTSHSRPILCITLCVNSRFLCTGSADRSICVYDLTKKILHKRLRGHLAAVYCLAISGNSKYIASGSNDTTARLWSLKSGRILRVFSGHRQQITSVSFHPNTLYLATGSADKNVRMWAIHEALPVRLLTGAKKEVYAIGFSPDGKFIACSSEDKKVRVWELISSTVLHEFNFEDSSVIHLKWSKNAKHLCGATISGEVIVWQIGDSVDNTDSLISKSAEGRILDLDCTFGVWNILTVPFNSPFDALKCGA